MAIAGNTGANTPTLPRCRLCGANDRDGLIEQLAARLWESRVDDGSSRQWDTCPTYWRVLFLDHAGVAIDMLEGR